MAEEAQLLLMGLDGRALERDLLREFVAEPVTILGELLQRGDSRLLKIDPRALRHTRTDCEHYFKHHDLA